MLISPAYAQTGAEPNLLTAFLPIILIFVVFYFLLIRPQNKRMKEHRAMLEAVRRGDKVVTNGGLVGLVTKVYDQENQLQLEIADGVRVRVQRDMLSNVLSKTEPAPSKDKDKDASNDEGDKDGDA